MQACTLLLPLLLQLYLDGSTDFIALRRVSQAFIQLPDAASHGAHAKSTTNVIQDSVWAWLAAVLYLSHTALLR
jgi:hypothetical protein